MMKEVGATRSITVGSRNVTASAFCRFTFFMSRLLQRQQPSTFYHLQPEWDNYGRFEECPFLRTVSCVLCVVCGVHLYVFVHVLNN